jgi:penicillin-binding protein 1A
MKLRSFILRLFPLAICGALMLFSGIYLHLSPKLPSVEVLKDVRLQTPMRVYSREGDLIGQFGEKKRNPLPYSQIPPLFVRALLAAEDDGFFTHVGIDIMGLLRAVSELVLTGEKGSGGSTLTMQVARNYFLTLERTFTRKFKEILLSLEIERVLSKEEILELYFNQMFLGHRAYGFEAAAQVYYGSHIGELDLAQLAMLAGLPKAPSRYNPISNPERALIRRNWILGRMRSLGYIEASQYQLAQQEPVTATHHGAKLAFPAPYAAEMARSEMVRRYGLTAYSDGYHVYTTIGSALQQSANLAVVNGLAEYDSRHGYRGPEEQLPAIAGEDMTPIWLAKLS